MLLGARLLSPPAGLHASPGHADAHCFVTCGASSDGNPSFPVAQPLPVLRPAGVSSRQPLGKLLCSLPWIDSHYFPLLLWSTARISITAAGKRAAELGGKVEGGVLG